MKIQQEQRDMFHRAEAFASWGLPNDLEAEVKKLFDEFIDIVKTLVDEKNLKKAIVRSMFPCNMIVIYDDLNLSVAAQKSAGGIIRYETFDQRNSKLSSQAVYENAKWEYGFEDPFVIQFPITLLSLEKNARADSLKPIALSHIQSEINRMNKEMNIIQLNPIFGAASFSIDPRLVFVLMPFDVALKDIYNSIVKPAIESDEFNLVCRRADEFQTNKAIMEDIWKAICESRIIIADLTRLNPNVMYELGIAHTVGKETILIYQKEENIKFPFDLAHIRRIEYTNDAVGGKKLEQDLKATIRNIVEKRVRTSPN